MMRVMAIVGLLVLMSSDAPAQLTLTGVGPGGNGGGTPPVTDYLLDNGTNILTDNSGNRLLNN